MPELPTTSRGAATSRRILDAAAEEFAAYGIAGARIDRIVAAARSNKAQLYGYYGGKDGLLDAVIADRADRLLSAVSFTADDLPGWAVGMYDENVRRPELVRLMSWLRLERRPTGRLSDSPYDEAKLAAITRAQQAGRVREGDPLDLFTMVLAMSLAWSPAGSVHAASAGDPDADHERRRALLHDCVRRAVTP